MKAAVALAIVAGAVLIFGVHLLKRDAERVKIIKLVATYDRWVDSGRPNGADLSRFLDGRYRELTVYTQQFSWKGTNYSGILAFTGRGGRSFPDFVITTNRIVFQLNRDGSYIPVH